MPVSLLVLVRVDARLMPAIVAVDARLDARHCGRRCPS